MAATALAIMWRHDLIQGQEKRSSYHFLRWRKLPRNSPADLMGGITCPHLNQHWQKEWGHHDRFNQQFSPRVIFPSRGHLETFLVVIMLHVYGGAIGIKLVETMKAATYSAQDSPTTEDYSGVNSVEFEKPCLRPIRSKP